MSSYEYTVIPAPARADKIKGASTGIERYAATLSATMNDMARDGWEYVRAETLPAEERSGLTSRATVYHNLLIFRRDLTARNPDRQAASDPQPLAASEPEPSEQPPIRAPFSEPMRAMPRQQAHPVEPPLSAPHLAPPAGPRLGPATR